VGVTAGAPADRGTVVDGNVHLVAAGGPAGQAPGPAGPAVDPAVARTWGSDWPDGQTLTVEAYHKAMEAAGVAKAVLTTTVRHDGFDNTCTAAAAAADPARFAFVGNFDVLAPNAPAVIEEQASRWGMRGARFYGGAAADAATWLGDERAAAAWAVARRLGLVVSAQRTRAASLGPLRAIVRRFPDVPVVVHSAGDPVLAAGPADSAEVDAGDSAEVDAICALATWPNVLIMLASKNWSAGAPAGQAGERFLRRLADAFGPDRLMWGSYSQFAGARLPASGVPGPGPARSGPSLGDLVAGVSERLGFLAPRDRSLVLGGTAERTFWPGQASPGGSSDD
jgi:predicted TIM-barrel fold metal-dependent hydrolase